MQKITQAEYVLELLQEGRKLSPKDVWDCGITRLSAIIYTLRKKGYNIVTHKKTYQGTFRIVTYAEYELVND